MLNTGAGAGKNVIVPVQKPVPTGEIKERLENEIKTLEDNREIENQITVFKDERGIVIRIMDRALFDEGRAGLKESAKNALKTIVPIIKASNNQIRIEGHSDNKPINTGEFKSNWELSVRRATEVVRHLIETHGFPPNMISASGYAEYRPIVPNDTVENRAINRRIEIILLQTDGITSTSISTEKARLAPPINP